MKSKSKLKFEEKKTYTLHNNGISREDKAVWFIWIGLIIIAVGALPFIARGPSLTGFIADLCLAIVQ